MSHPKESIVDIATTEMRKRFNAAKIPSLQEIFEDVCMIFNEKPERVVSKLRKKELVLIRKIYCYMACLITHEGLKEIGTFVGANDHTFVIHHRDAVAGFIKVKEPSFISKWDYYCEHSKIWKNFNQK